jgi:hypothetical protein
MPLISIRCPAPHQRHSALKRHPHARRSSGAGAKFNSGEVFENTKVNNDIMNDGEIKIVTELQANDVLAYNYEDAGRVLGLSYGTIRNEMIRGHIRPLNCQYKLIARDELIRWVKEREDKPTPRKRAKRVNAPANSIVLTE